MPNCCLKHPRRNNPSADSTLIIERALSLYWLCSFRPNDNSLHCFSSITFLAIAMPLRERFDRLKERLHPRHRSSEQLEERKQGDGNQTDAPAVSNVFPATTSSTNLDAPPTPISPVLAVSNAQVELEPSPRPSSLIAQHQSASLAEHLWDRAYDELKENESEAALVQAYERILSRHLRDRDLASDSDVDEENIIAQDDPGARRAQMRTLVTSGWAKIERETKMKESLDKGVQALLSAKRIISSAIQTVPQAALAWTGVCVALEVRYRYLFRQ